MTKIEITNQTKISNVLNHISKLTYRLRSQYYDHEHANWFPKQALK